VEIQASGGTATMISGLSWTGIATGKDTLCTPDAGDTWYRLPNLEPGESYTPEIVNIRVEGLDGGCAGSGCGEASAEAPGSGRDWLGSASFLISLGAGTATNSAGSIFMNESTPSELLATPAALKLLLNANCVSLTTNADSTIDIAAPTMLAKIAVSNEYSYWIHCSRKSGGEYLLRSLLDRLQPARWI